MKNAKLLCALAFLPIFANAADYDVTIGQSLYENGHDDFWYQEPFQHSWDYHGKGFEIGVTNTLWASKIFSLDYRAAWNYLGQMSIQSYAVPDANYNIPSHSCIASCSQQSNYVGTGHNQGFSLSLEPKIQVGTNYKVGLEVGAYVYKNTFSENITLSGGNLVLNVSDNYKWTIGKVIGVSIKRDNLTLRYQYFRNGDHFGDHDVNVDIPAAWHSTHMISIGYTF